MNISIFVMLMMTLFLVVVKFMISVAVRFRFGYFIVLLHWQMFLWLRWFPLLRGPEHNVGRHYLMVRMMVQMVTLNVTIVMGYWCWWLCWKFGWGFVCGCKRWRSSSSSLLQTTGQFTISGIVKHLAVGSLAISFIKRFNCVGRAWCSC